MGTCTLARLFFVGIVIFTTSFAEQANAAENNLDKCGTTEPDENTKVRVRSEIFLASQKARFLPKSKGVFKINIPVYFHFFVGQGDDNRKGDKLAAAAQVAILNSDFSQIQTFGVGIFFNLKGVKVHEMPTVTPTEFINIFNKKYRMGGPGDLNILVADLGETLLGQTTYPWNDEVSSGAVIINWDTLPGANPLRHGSHHNLGKTAVHEVGHWLGLFHVFSGGCNLLGDEIADTAPQNLPIYYCPTVKTFSCGSLQEDPIHNYMNYTSDFCKTEFTAGQADRMLNTYLAYRLPQILRIR